MEIGSSDEEENPGQEGASDDPGNQDASAPSRYDSPEEWEDDPTEDQRDAVLFSSQGKEHAFFSPQGDPRSFREALQRADAAEWTDAALEELAAHLRNGTWTVVDLPPGKVAIGS